MQNAHRLGWASLVSFCGYTSTSVTDRMMFTLLLFRFDCCLLFLLRATMAIRLHIYNQNNIIRSYLEGEFKKDHTIKLVSTSSSYVEIFQCLDEAPIDVLLMSSSDRNYDQITKLLGIVYPRTRIVGLAYKDSPAALLNLIHPYSFLCHYNSAYEEIRESIEFVYRY